jgi:hypothetical protein
MPQRIDLTVAEVIEMQTQLIEESCGLRNIRDSGLLESSVARPQNGYYADITEEAAALMESLANKHAFDESNKRVSFSATGRFRGKRLRFGRRRVGSAQIHYRGHGEKRVSICFDSRLASLRCKNRLVF